MTGPIDYGDGGPPIDRPIARQCKGHKSDGSRCRRSASHGAVVCASHGASAPQVKAAAMRRVAEEEACGELARMGVPPLGNPLKALAQLAAEAVAWKDRLAAKVDELAALTAKSGVIHGEVAAYERALDRTLAFCVAMARLNIDERIVAVNMKISEAQGLAVARAIDRILTALDVRNDPRVPAVVPRELRAITSDDLDA